MPDRARYDVNNQPSLMAVSSADGASPVDLWADPTTHALVSSGGAGGGGASTIADGADVAEGATTDAAVTAGSTGTVSGKLRQISSDISAGNTAQTNGTQQTKVTDGTNIVNVLKSDGTAAGQNAAIVAGSGLTTATLTLNSSTPNTAWFDMLNYPSFSVEILTNTTPATLTFQTSGDASQTNIRSTIVSDSSAALNIPVVTTTSTNGTFTGNRTGRYFRVSSNNGAGTTTLVITFFTIANAASAIIVSGGLQPVVSSNTTSGFIGSAMMAGFDDVSPTAVTENQFGTVRMSTNRNLYNTIRDAAGNERGVNVNASNQLTTADAASSATGSAVPANAFYQGVNPQTALPTAATAGNLTGITADKFGRPVVLSGTIRDLVGTQTTTISASTAETTVVTAAASTFNDLTALVISNTSATAARLDFRDTTGGSILFSIYVPAGDVRGVAFNRPVPQTSVNTNWTTQSSASITDLRVYAVFDKNK